MRRVTRLLAGSVALVIPVTFMWAGGPRAKAAPLTVADFAAVLTSSGDTGRLEAPDQAAQRLLALGVPLGDPRATLTEGRLSAIMGFYGIRTTTSNPDALVDAGRGHAAAAILGSTVMSFFGSEKKPVASPAGQPTGPPTVDLDVCLSERNRGQCVNCCKGLGSPANACAHFCQSIEHPSPSVPR